MRYFANINNPEELKKAFRAYCVTMHPDKGGDPEEFKTMLNEYEQAAKSCGAWTKETREEVQGVRRGLRVVFFGAGMVETRYIITSVQGDKIKLLRIFSRDFRSLEDVDTFFCGEWSDDKSRRELNKFDHIRPLSKKFGIGYYWDDVDNKTYTEQEISEAERIADNFDRWAANWKANKKEEERRAQEEADREENAIISEWSAILEKLPEEYKRSMSLSDFNLSFKDTVDDSFFLMALGNFVGPSAGGVSYTGGFNLEKVKNFGYPTHNGNWIASNQYNVGLTLSVSGTMDKASREWQTNVNLDIPNGNHALLIPRGDIAGFRPMLTKATQSRALSKMECVVVCEYPSSSSITLTLPDDPEIGQYYKIIQLTGQYANKAWGKTYIKSNRSDKPITCYGMERSQTFKSDWQFQITEFWYDGTKWIAQWHNVV